MTTRGSFSWKALFGCSRKYGRDPCEMDERTLAVPNVGVGSWRLGLSLHQATSAIAAKMRPDERVKVIVFHDQEVVVVLPYGVLLDFDGESQLLERITIQYPWPPGGLSMELPSVTAEEKFSPMRICENQQRLLIKDIRSFPLRTSGQTSAGDGRELCYAGISFIRSAADREICEQVCVHSDISPLTPLCPPNGVVARRVSGVVEPGNTLYTGLQFDLEIGVPPDSIDWTNEREGENDHMYMPTPAYSHTDSRYVSFGQSEQEVQLALGAPEDTFIKRQSSNAAPDFFFNYNAFGVDLMFDGVTRRVIKFILHTNAPQSIHFGQYARCPFSLQIRCCCSCSLQEQHRPHGTGHHVRAEVKSSSYWSDIKEHVLCGCAREMHLLKNDSLPQPSTANNVTQTMVLCCVYDQFAFEVLNNGCLATVTMLQHCAYKSCCSRGKNPHRAAAENFNNIKQSTLGSSARSGISRSASQRRSEKKSTVVTTAGSSMLKETSLRREASTSSHLRTEEPAKEACVSGKAEAGQQGASASPDMRRHKRVETVTEGPAEEPQMTAEQRIHENTPKTEHLSSGGKMSNAPQRCERKWYNASKSNTDGRRIEEETVTISESSSSKPPTNRLSKVKTPDVRQTAASMARRAHSSSVKGKTSTPTKQERAVKRTPSGQGGTLSGGKQLREKAESTPKALSRSTSSPTKPRKQVQSSMRASAKPFKDNLPESTASSNLAWVSLEESNDDVSFQNYRQGFTPQRALARTPPSSPPAVRKAHGNTGTVASNLSQHQCLDHHEQDQILNKSKNAVEEDKRPNGDMTLMILRTDVLATSNVRVAPDAMMMMSDSTVPSNVRVAPDAMMMSDSTVPSNATVTSRGQSKPQDNDVDSDMNVEMPRSTALPLGQSDSQERSIATPPSNRKSWGPPRGDLLDDYSQSLHEDDTLIEVLEHGHHDVVRMLSDQTKLLVELKEQWLNGHISSALFTICRRCHDDENYLATLVNILCIICDQRLVGLYPAACLQVMPLLKMLVGPMKPDSYIAVGCRFVTELIECFNSSIGAQSREVVLDKEIAQIREELLRFRSWLNTLLECKGRHPELQPLFNLRQRMLLL